MPQIEGLRSCYATVGGIVFFGRMLDKIRLHTAGRLPAEYHNNIAKGFDARTCAFLGVDHTALRERVLVGGTDEEILAWCLEKGGGQSEDACYVWSRFMRKIGWRDDRSEVLKQRVAESGLVGKPIETFFDLIEFDEGRDPVAAKAWLLQ